MEHRGGLRDHGNRIWRLLNLELWQRVALDGEDASSMRTSQTSAAVR